jgi:hypothetical protein
MLKYLNLKFLIAGIAIGIIILYVYNGDKAEIVKFPHPENVGKLVYKDNNNLCYKFKAKEVDCAENADKIETYPFQ